MYERRRTEFINTPQRSNQEKLSSRMYQDIADMAEFILRLESAGLVEEAQIAKAIQRRQYENLKIARYDEMSANLDQLTTLYNRQSFETVFKGKIAEVEDRRKNGDLNAALYILRIDLDKFKAINDTLGHDAGDIYLTSIATEMAVGLRPDDFIARVGGDEFVILISNPDQKFDAKSFGNRQQEAVKLGSLKAKWNPKLSGLSHSLNVTASIGVDVFRGLEDPNVFFERVDALCYTAKDVGGDAFVDREMATQLDSKRI